MINNDFFLLFFFLHIYVYLFMLFYISLHIYLFISNYGRIGIEDTSAL